LKTQRRIRGIQKIEKQDNSEEVRGIQQIEKQDNSE
jgi:hypothetical protein